jgi:hypothetical protein
LANRAFGNWGHKNDLIDRRITMDEEEPQAYNDNEDKLRPSLVLKDTVAAFWEEVAVAEYGCRKYSRYNWSQGHDFDEFLMENNDFMLRHLIAYMNGGTHDKESGFHHLAHIRRRAGIGLQHEAMKRKPS